MVSSSTSSSACTPAPTRSDVLEFIRGLAPDATQAKAQQLQRTIVKKIEEAKIYAENYQIAQKELTNKVTHLKSPSSQEAVNLFAKAGEKDEALHRGARRMQFVASLIEKLAQLCLFAGLLIVGQNLMTSPFVNPLTLTGFALTGAGCILMGSSALLEGYHRTHYWLQDAVQNNTEFAKFIEDQEMACSDEKEGQELLARFEEREEAFDKVAEFKKEIVALEEQLKKFQPSDDLSV